MNTEIDQRIVEMKFDNKNFERNVSTSMSTLKKFKESLKFEGATKGLDEFEQKASRFSLFHLEEAADKVEVKFNAMSVAAVAAITKIVNTAMDAGVKLVKSLSTDNIVAGWQKYEDKTASVQTIMNATGKSIDKVNGYLEKLSWFSDETSYSFIDMTRAIAQMTSSGGDIDKLIPLVTGVANATAYAGKGVAEFQRALYNLNQSYSLGYLTSIDWKSFELAGIGSKQLKQALIDAGVALGKFKKDQYALTDFSQMLSKKLFDREVIEKAFGYFGEMSEEAFKMVNEGVVDTAAEAYERLSEKYDKVQSDAAKAAQSAKKFSEVIEYTKDAVGSGWMKTFELIIGNYNEAKKLYTQLAEEFYVLFVKGGEERNEILEEALSSGWSQLLKKGISDSETFQETLISNAKAAGRLDDEMEQMVREDIAATLKDGWINADILAKSLSDTTIKLHQFTEEQLKEQGMTQDEIDGLKQLEAAMYSGELEFDKFVTMLQRDSGRENLVQAFWNIWNALFSIDEETQKATGLISIFREALREIFPGTTAEKIYNLTVKIREFTEGLIFTGDQAEGLKNIFKAILTPVKWIVDLVGKGLQGVGKLVKGLGSLSKGFLTLFKDAKPSEVILTKLFGDKKKTEIINAYQNAISKVRLEFGKLKEKAVEAITSLQANEKLKPALDKIHAVLVKIGNWVSDKIVSGLEAISRLDVTSLINNVATGFTNFASGVIDAYHAVKDFISGLDWSSVGKWIGNIGVIFKEVVDSFKIKIDPNFGFGKLLTKVKEESKNLPEMLGKVKDALIDFAKNLTPAKILIFAFGVVLVSLFSQIDRLISSTSTLVTNISNIFVALQKKLIKTSPILQFATAVGAVTAALVILSNIPVNDLKKAGIALAGITGALFAMGTFMMVFSKKLANPAVALGIDLFAKGILKFAAAITLLSASLLLISRVDTGHISSQLVAFSVLLVEFAVVGRIISGVAPGLAKGGLGLIALAASLVILTKAFKVLKNTEPSDMYATVVALIPVFAAFLALGVAARVATAKGAIGLTLMAANILLIVSVFKKLENVDVAKILNVMPQFLLLASSLVALSLVSASAGGKYAARAGVAIMAAAGAVMILTGVVKELGSMDKAQVKQGTQAVAALIGMFAVLTGLSALSGQYSGKLAKTFLAMSIAVSLLILPIKAVGKLPESEAKQGTAVVATLMGMFALILGISKLASKATGSIIAMGLVIGVLVASLVLLTLPDYNELMGAAKALTMVLAGLSIALIAIKHVSSDKPSLGGLGAVMFEMITLLLACVAALHAIPSGFTGEQMAGFGIAIAAMAAGIGVAVLAISKLPVGDFSQILRSVGQFALVGTAMIAFATVFSLIFSNKTIKDMINSEGSLESILKGLAIMGIAAVEITAVTAGLALITKAVGNIDAKAFGNAVLGFLEVSGALALLIAAFAGIYSLLTDGLGVSPEKISVALDGAVEIFEAIGEAIGRFVGGFVGGGLALLLKDIGEGLAGFFDAFASVDAKNADTLVVVAEALKQFAVAGLLEGLSAFFGGVDIQTLGEQLDEFIPFLVEFGNQTSGVDFSGAETAAKAAAGFGEFLNALPREGGLVGSIIGDHQSLKKFSEGLPFFGMAITMLQSSLPSEGVDQQLIDSAVNAGKVLAGLEKTLPRGDGLLQTVIGERESMVQFAMNLETFGIAITSYQKAIFDGTGGQGINEELVKSSANAGMALSKLETSLPRSGGALQAFIGEQSMTKFASDMEMFGKAIVSYSNIVSEGGIDAGAITLSTVAGTMLSKLNDSLPKTGGKLQDWLGEQNLETFANGIAKLGGAIANYSQSVSGIKIDAADAATKVAESINAVALNLGDNKVASFFTGKTTLSSFGDQLITFGKKVKAYGEAISGSQWKEIERSSEVVIKLSKMGDALANLSSVGMISLANGLEMLAKGGLEAFANAFKNTEAETIIYNAGLGFVTSFENALQATSSGPMEIEAKRMVTTFFGYFNESAESHASVAAGKIVTTIKTTFDDKHNDFVAIGEFIIAGIEQGIDNKWGSFQYFAIQKANSIKRTFQEALEIQSPSRVMRDEVGRYIVEGIAEGIKDDMTSEEAAAKKAQNITAAFKDIFAKNDAELKKIQLDYQTQKLENPFWSREEIKDIELEQLAEEVKYARKKFEIETAKFKAASEQFEEGSLEWLEASNNYDQAWIDYLKTEQSYNNARASRDEVQLIFDNSGKALISGFLNGITADMTMEDAAKQKAENIVTAFSKTFEKLESKYSTSNFQTNMWKIANPEYDEHAVGFSDNQQQNDAKQMVTKILKNRQDIEAQAEKLKYAQTEYNATVKAFGDDSDYAKSALSKLQEAELNLMELAAEQQDLKKYKPAYSRAMNMISQMSEDEVTNWFTTIQKDNPIKKIFDEAIAAAGDVPEIVLDNMEEAFKPLMDDATYQELTGKVEVVFPEAIANSTEAVVNAAGSVGSKAGQAFADEAEAAAFGKLNGIWASIKSGVLNAASGETEINNLLNQFTGQEGFFNKLKDSAAGILGDLGNNASGAAQSVVTGLSNKLTEGKETVKKASTDLAEDGVLGVFHKLFKWNSPSKVAEEIGEYWVVGLSIGMLKMLDELKNNSKTVANAVITPAEEMLSVFDRIFQGDFDFEPTISPVLDLSNVYSQASRLTGILDTSGTFNLATQAFSDGEQSRIAREEALTQSLIDSIGARLEGLNVSLDDLRDVVEAHGQNDLIIDVNVDGASLARMTVSDYLLASRANGTPFWEPSLP